MSALDRKLMRDLLQMKGQAIAISLVIASGVGVFVMAVGTWDFLKNTRDTYYDRYRFAHVFASVKRAPRSIMERVREIPGVASAEARIADQVTLDVPGLNEPAVARVISLPTHGPPLLNRLHVTSGRTLDPIATGEVLASQQFAEANKLKPGSEIKAVINGRLQGLRVVGIVLSPEYVFTIRAGDIVPDDLRFGILWMNEPEMEAAFDMEGAFNDVSLRLMHGASEPEVIQRLDLLLAPYGAIGAYGHDSQMSARFLADELKQLRAMAVVAPSIFFGVAVFLLNVVLTRIVGMQREQIAALKAFGYSNFDVGLHYLKFVQLIAFAGCIIGTGIGEWLALGMAGMYSTFYKFPVFQYHVNWNLPLLVTVVSLIAAGLGTVLPVWNAVRLPPAEAMRPAPPGQFKPTIIERIGIAGLFSTAARMILRELERRPFKSILSSVGIAFAVAVLIMGRFGVDAFNYLIDFQFYLTQRNDMSVTFFDATTASAVHDVEHLPGVQQVETFRSVPARLRNGHRTHRTAILGLGEQRDLYRVLDVHEQPLSLPSDGIVMGDKLAEMLHLRPGDLVTVEVLDGERQTLQIPLMGTFMEYAGASAYMSKAALHRALREDNVVSGAWITIDSDRQDELYRELKQTPRVAGVSVKTATVESFRKTVTESQLQMQRVNIIFACVIAFGVVYNTARISLAERSRELATLRVIGFTRGEISGILLGELAVLTLASLPIGFGIGYWFCWTMAKGFESEMVRIPVIITSDNMGFAAFIVIFASVLSGLVVRRRLDELDLVAVLKSRD